MYNFQLDRLIIRGLIRHYNYL